jgi:hypothetical protein
MIPSKRAHVVTLLAYIQEVLVPNHGREMDLREIGWDGTEWIDMAQDMYQWRALVNTALNIRVP